MVSSWILSEGAPLVRHHLADTIEVQEPFTLTGLSFSRRCSGVRAHHPAYGESRLCGIRIWGHADPWRGRTIHLTGRRSDHGLIWERYRVEPPVPPQ